MLMHTINMSTVCLTQFGQKVDWVNFGKTLFILIPEKVKKGVEQEIKIKAYKELLGSGLFTIRNLRKKQRIY